MKHTLLTYALVFLTIYGVAAPLPPAGSLPSRQVPSAITPAQNAMLNNQALCFIENKGQVVDQLGRQRKDIDFKVAEKGVNVFVGNAELHYMLYRRQPAAEAAQATFSHVSKTQAAPGKRSIELYRLDVKLLGANKHAKVTSEDEQNYQEIDYLAQCPDGVVAHSFNKITYANVYPNIDWVLYLRDNQLEYDFVVRPGGRVSDIKMAYGGATDLVLSEEKGLAAVTPLGTIMENQPRSYEQDGGKAVKSAFAMHGQVITFKVADHVGTLVIDPNPKLDWATYYGQFDDEGLSVTCDPQGNVYMDGNTTSSTNLATTGSYQSAPDPRQDAFLVKFSPAGSRLWGTYYGGRDLGGEGTGGLGLSCDPAGNVYMTGTTQCSGLATPGAYRSSVIIPTTGNYDGFLVKFNAFGGRQWATYFGGGAHNGGMVVGVACDGTGNAYITGWTQSDTGIATAASYQNRLGGTDDAFLAKFSAAGALQWATYFGGTRQEEINGIACDGNGHVYIKGNTGSKGNIATAGSYQPVIKGTWDGFLAQFNYSGQLQWSTYYGSKVMLGANFGGACTSLACDHYGHVYISDAMDTTGYATPGSFQAAAGSSYNAYLAQFNTAGSLQWATYYGGNNSYAWGVACDTLGYVYLSGGVDTASTNVATAGSYQTTYGKGFLAKFNSAGKRQWGTYHNFGFGQNSIACFGQGITYLTGITTATTGIATPGSFQTSFAGFNNAFLARFISQNSTVKITEPFTDTVLCAGSTFGLNFYVTNSFEPGNVFIAQLSDASGSFASPSTIGSYTGITNGTIACTVPTGTSTGTGYKIRIIASLPEDTSVITIETISIITLAGMRASATAGCLGTSITLTADSLLAGQTYHWTGPNGLNTGNSVVVIPNSTYADSGKYVVVSKAGACTQTDTVHVGIIPGPAKPVAMSNSPICAGDTLLLKGSNISPGAGFYWTGPVGFHSILLNPVLTSAPLSDSGIYVLTANLDGCLQSDTILVQVHASSVPTVNITVSTFPLTVGRPATFTAHSTGCPNPVFQWYNGSTLLNGQTDSTMTITITQNTNVKVVVHCSGCANPDMATSNSLGPVGVASLSNGLKDIMIYPNPVSDFVMIEHARGTTAKLCNVLGQVLLTQILTKDRESINTSGLAAGTFVLTLISEQGESQEKVMVKE